ncbi:MAG: PEP-CTERM sorting domain-containing protein [Alphaproteobacteria bacterium]|nr:PEP-CTERM sorting domain-containing protein [Alphaproteobacteria bacterium]
MKTCLPACIVAAAVSAMSASAAVITDAPTLPVLGADYASPSGAGCFPAMGVCITSGVFTLTAPVSSTFVAVGQDIVTGAAYHGTLTTLGGTPVGPVALTGMIEQVVLGRTAPDQTGSWITELLALSLSGPVLGATLTMTLSDVAVSSGTTAIVPLDEQHFSIDSFFDVFVELSLDTPTPLTTTRGPIPVSLVASPVPVPAPGTLAILGIGLAGLSQLRRRPRRT